ncbi:hypothetical protein RND81_04G183000 [Saponaria officinalis]|uniref:Uncharacterized protein n=1 Tax=Saponaria officinalis TaxID=3572 RepID=A0AAW1LMN0_SAPOF
MTKSSLFYFNLIILAILPALTISTSDHDNDNGLKSMHLRLNQSGTVNESDYLAVSWVVGPKVSDLHKSSLVRPVLVFNKDKPFRAPDPLFEDVRDTEGTGLTSIFDRVDGFSVAKICFGLHMILRLY